MAWSADRVEPILKPWRHKDPKKLHVDLSRIVDTVTGVATEQDCRARLKGARDVIDSDSAGPLVYEH